VGRGREQHNNSNIAAAAAIVATSSSGGVPSHCTAHMQAGPCTGELRPSPLQCLSRQLGVGGSLPGIPAQRPCAAEVSRSPSWMALACPWVLLGWGCRHQALGALSSVRASSMHTHSRCREVSMHHPGNGWGWCPSQISRCACHPLVCTPLHNRQGPCLAPSISSFQRVCECTEPSVP
jgi:hypothetical protein